MSSGADLPDRIAGAAEVSRTSTMDGVADEDRDLEFDSLANGKPVELVPQHRSDMVELPLVRDQQGSCVEDRLKSSHNNVSGSGCELDSWQCRICIIPHVQSAYDYSNSFVGYLGTYGLTQKLWMQLDSYIIWLETVR